MRIHSIHIENFRGIKLLDWQPDGRFACLIGPGNSTKSTILDAIELTLLPRWYAPVSDDDFHGGDTTQNVKIEVTIGDLPAILVRDDHLGNYLRGWSESSGIEDEPREGLSPVTTIRFTLDASLEPTWHVVNDRVPDGVHVAFKDREQLGLARLGGDIDRQLTWMRGSALPRLGVGSADATDALATAMRAARTAIQNIKLSDQFTTAAAAAYEAAKDFGAAPSVAFSPQLGGAATISLGAMELFEGPIPARTAGLGSRRLAALGIQSSAVRDGAILLVDEVESGLEPHRIGRLLLKLRKFSPTSGHAILTTHSPVVLRELDADDLYVTHRTADRVDVLRVGPELQDLVRSVPEALLATRILVCEGKTEYGLIDTIRHGWEQARSAPLAHKGATFVSGAGSGGSAAPGHALKLATLGYQVALFADSDTTSTPSDSDLQAAGVSIIRWAGSCNTEQRVARDLPVPGLQALLDFVVGEKGEPSVLQALQVHLTAITTVSVADWCQGGTTLDDIRAAIGAAASKQKWFKDIELGRALGNIVRGAWDGTEGTDLRAGLDAAENWFYA